MIESPTPLTLCFHAIPKGKRCALLPGKPLRTFPGIALGEDMPLWPAYRCPAEVQAFHMAAYLTPKPR
ncbi:MAG: hypothetical protein EOS78_25000 [Mesorhizobium sp.]|nr:MAG: hypothetical protein EOS78_25000 [Mesorhizobium sp.]